MKARDVRGGGEVEEFFKREGGVYLVLLGRQIKPGASL